MRPWFTPARYRALQESRTMADQFGRPGRRADLARLLYHTLIARGMDPVDGAARAIIDRRVSEVAEALGVSETAALRHLRDEDVVALAASTADHWHAAGLADDAAGDFAVSIPGSAAAQLVMGLAMAAGQMIREVYGELPASAGQPLDALCELGSALRESLEATSLTVETSLHALGISHRTLLAAAAGVADGSVPVVVAAAQRPAFAQQLYEDARLAKELQP